MAVTVETLEKLERKITLDLPLEPLRGAVQERLKKVARTVRMDGFRPGKVPMGVVAQRYGQSLQYEVLNEQAGQAFWAAIQEAGLRLAGEPGITEADGAPEGHIRLDAVFEVLPEITFGDLSGQQVRRIACTVDEAAIDKTLDILRKQRRTFAQRAQADAAAEGDRVTVDFDGQIDAQPFDGGSARDFQFLIGEGQMLGAFDDAVRGLRAGESKTFPLTFPENYNPAVAGKTAEFTLTVKKIEQAKLPEITDAFAKSLGIKDASVAGLRADVRKNLEREVKYRIEAINKKAAVGALLACTEFDLPKASVQAENKRLQEAARRMFRERGMKDVEKVEFPDDMFLQRAQDNVREALAITELARTHEALRPRPEQVQARVRELAGSYEKPQEVERWYQSSPERMTGVETWILEANVLEYLFGQMQVQEQTMSFEELMRQAPSEEAQGGAAAGEDAPPAAPQEATPAAAASATA